MKKLFTSCNPKSSDSSSKNVSDPAPACTAEKSAETRPQATILKPRHFDINSEKQEGLDHLDSQGYVVWKNAISQELIDEYISEVWAWIGANSKGKVKRDDPSTWNDESWRDAGLLSYTGILADKGYGHLPSAWKVREACHPHFAAVWKVEGEDSLMCSFDGGNIMRPTRGDNGGKPEYETATRWLHVDHDGWIPKHMSGFQGVVCVTGADDMTIGANAGGFACVPGSHLEFDTWMASNMQRRRQGKYFTTVSHEDPMMERLCLIAADRGSLIIWKAETFHCNEPNRSDAWRHAQYVNMEPSKVVPVEVVEERLTAFAEGRATTHWVHECRITSMNMAVIRGVPNPSWKPPVLSPLGERLLGKAIVASSSAEAASSSLEA